MDTRPEKSYANEQSFRDRGRAGFPGQWFQTESSLHQNWMRDYDPTTGRYVEPDPLGLVDGASVYSYVRQNPAKYIDPKGEDLYVSNFDGSAAGFGHLGLSTDIGGGAAQTEGFYNTESCCSGEGAVQPDDMANMTQMTRVPLNPLDTLKVQICIDRRKQNPGRYNLLNRSCVDFVRDCLDEVGISLSNGNRPDMVYDGLVASGQGTSITGGYSVAPPRSDIDVVAP